MFTFNPFFNNQLFPFGFNFPRFYNNRSRCRLNTLMGIPMLRTTGVSASSTTAADTVNKFLSSYCFYFRRILLIV